MEWQKSGSAIQAFKNEYEQLFCEDCRVFLAYRDI
jgi:hypothetical protein